MGRGMRWSLGAAAAAAVVAASTLAAPQAFAALTSWSVVTSPDAGAMHNDLHAVAAASASTVFAVGESFNGSADRTLILHETATGWAVVTSPNVGTRHNTLFGISVLSATRAWAVGSYYSGTADRTLVLEWNGSTWKVQPSPNLGRNHNELDAVSAAAPNNVWAVGMYFNGTKDRTLIEHYNGTKWAVVSSPNVGTNHNVLDAVSVVPKTRGAQVWAAGSYFNGKNDQTLVERFRRGHWSVVRSVNVGTEGNALGGIVAVSPNAVFAAGMFSEGHRGSTVHTNQTLVERWNGTAWKATTTDNVGTFNNEFVAIFATGPTSVYAVGRYFDGTADKALVQHWNGTVWHVSTSANATTNHNELEGATAVRGSSPVAVGTYFSGTADRTLVESCKSCK